MVLLGIWLVNLNPKDGTDADDEERSVVAQGILSKENCRILNHQSPNQQAKS